MTIESLKLVDYTTKVPTEVENDVRAYFRKHLPEYEVQLITYYSNHPDDNYLFMVVSKKIGLAVKGRRYSVWTCWNQDSKSLNYGHYELSYQTAYAYIRRCFRDVYKNVYDTAKQASRTRLAIAAIRTDTKRPYVCDANINELYQQYGKFLDGVDYGEDPIPTISIKRFLEKERYISGMLKRATSLIGEKNLREALEQLIWLYAAIGDEAKAIAIRDDILPVIE